MIDLNAPPLVQLRVETAAPIRIILVGCGGTGSHIASGLVALAQDLRQSGKQITLHFIDGDKVEEKNIGRQLFSPADLGRNKAEALALRLGRAFNEVIDFEPIMVKDSMLNVVGEGITVIVGAVDNPAARAAIAFAVERSAGYAWWLDCGNENHSGQVAIGNAVHKYQMTESVSLGMTETLPAPSVLYPNLVATPKAKTGKKLSCAELTALGEQSLMVNRLVASWALSMLSDFLRGSLKVFAVEFNMKWGSSKGYPIDVPTLAKAWGVQPSVIEYQPKKKVKAVRR